MFSFEGGEILHSLIFYYSRLVYLHKAIPVLCSIGRPSVSIILDRNLVPCVSELLT